MADRARPAELLEAALEYAGRGLPVFPCHARGKTPLTEHGLHDASTDTTAVLTWWTRWPEANIGIVTGAASGLVVLDVDVQHGGQRSLAALEAEHGKLAATPEVLTGGGGKHLYFAHPGETVGNSAGRLGAGLDIRGDGGYVVAPPSLHASGRPYKWLRPGRKLELGQPPAWLLAEVAKRRNGPAPKVDTVIPAGRRNDELASLAGSFRRRGMNENEILAALEAVNRERCRPPLPAGELEGIAASVARYEPAAELGKPAYSGPARELGDVVATFRHWLHLPDAGALYVALATVVANRLPGDPVWLLLVGPSSSGKTEGLVSLAGLDEVEPAATMTEAALLSGVPRKDVAAGASGGLLRKIGDYGILTLKDFGSVLSMRHETRAAVLAALRECYDGAWDRPVGADGGRVLHWHGKLGLVAGVTAAVDSHHAAIDSLGSRFAFYRLAVSDRRAQAGRALEHRRQAAGMRDELRDAVAGFFAGLELPTGDTLSDDDKHRLVALADFVTIARSPVERDRVSRDIELIPDAEAPARFGNMLAQLLEGLQAIGLDPAAAWQLVTKLAFDSMPAQRRKMIEHLAEAETTTTKAAAAVLGVPTTTARRTLEDLTAHSVLIRTPAERPGEPDTWALSPGIAVPASSSPHI
jgi:Bifunctional DNA primase/polymerase, N-terminal/Primase C terminal 1 (PriCT-1)/DeoR-like helix-turn-helix domain